MTSKIYPINALETGFLPERCVAELFDYNNVVRFRVFGAKDEILHSGKIARPAYNSTENLRGCIEDARSEIERKGFELAPWQMLSMPSEEE
jgi:hypothetical protein